MLPLSLCRLWQPDRAANAAQDSRSYTTGWGTIVTGLLPETAGPFKAGSRYCANNISALRWVYASLVESAIVAHEIVFGVLSAADRARHYS